MKILKQSFNGLGRKMLEITPSHPKTHLGVGIFDVEMGNVEQLKMIKNIYVRPVHFEGENGKGGKQIIEPTTDHYKGEWI